jgi:DNA-binding helix-hairpin-helix protein with protein kinase domain
MDSSTRRALAETLKRAELNYRQAQMALRTDRSEKARARYARALADYDRLQGTFQLTAALATVKEPKG